MQVSSHICMYVITNRLLGLRFGGIVLSPTVLDKAYMFHSRTHIK